MSDGNDTEIDPEERDRADAEMILIERHVAQLTENFDTVHIFCTRNIEDGSVIQFNSGKGNYFARVGQVGCWLRKQE